MEYEYEYIHIYIFFVSWWNNDKEWRPISTQNLFNHSIHKVYNILKLGHHEEHSFYGGNYFRMVSRRPETLFPHCAGVTVVSPSLFCSRSEDSFIPDPSSSPCSLWAWKVCGSGRTWGLAGFLKTQFKKLAGVFKSWWQWWEHPTMSFLQSPLPLNPLPPSPPPPNPRLNPRSLPLLYQQTLGLALSLPPTELYNQVVYVPFLQCFSFSLPS